MKLINLSKCKFNYKSKKNNGYKEYDYLCATHFTYFFLDLLIKKLKVKLIYLDYLIYVLLSYSL